MGSCTCKTCPSSLELCNALDRKTLPLLHSKTQGGAKPSTALCSQQNPFPLPSQAEQQVCHALCGIHSTAPDIFKYLLQAPVACKPPNPINNSTGSQVLKTGHNRDRIWPLLRRCCTRAPWSLLCTSHDCVGTVAARVCRTAVSAAAGAAGGSATAVVRVAARSTAIAAAIFARARLLLLLLACGSLACCTCCCSTCRCLACRLSRP